MPRTGSSIARRLAAVLPLALAAWALWGSAPAAGRATGAAGRAAGAEGPTVAVYLTTPGDRLALARRADERFRRGGERGAQATITVDPRRRLQTITGFGAAFTDSSLWLLSRLSPARREAALRRLLDPVRGIGISLARVPMGASDYSASGMYTYDDLPPGQGDPTLARFSIAHDQAYILPILRQALRIDPALRIIASPWSPPAWMKTDDSLASVSPDGVVGTLLPADYGALAQYFVRFLEGYRRAGVPVWAVTPQNEPLQATLDYPGMIMSEPAEAAFIARYLAPALRQAGLQARIYGYDHLWLGSRPYATALLAGPPAGPPAAGAGPALAGLAYHCYLGAPQSMAAIHARFPGADLLEDECSTGISPLSPIQVEIRSVESWASGALMWNVALDPAGGPKLGSGCPGCIGLMTVDAASGSVTPTGDYYELGQVSRFVRPGAARLATRINPAPPRCAASPECGLEAAGFADPGGAEVLVVTNSGPRPVTFAVRRPDGAAFTYRLAGRAPAAGADNSRDAAVVTFVWRAPARGSRRRARG